jgi:hypothetical protein
MPASYGRRRTTLPRNIIACLSALSVSGTSSAAHGRVSLCALLCPNCNQDTDNDVSVIVHCQQHDEISNSELQHIQESSYKLLFDV